MKILCVFGKHNYGDPGRGLSYEYVNFLPAFSRLGHEVVFFESWNKCGYNGFPDLNRQFIATVKTTQPDLIFCVLLGYEVWIETLLMVRKVSDAVLINWSTDDSWKYDQFSRFILPYFDLYATTYPQANEKAKQAGYQHVILSQWAANAANLREPIPASKCRWNVSFIGTAYGNRTQWISALRKRGIRVNCHGHGWKNGPVDAGAIPDIIRHSVISLNFGDSNWMLKGIIPYRSRQIKARVFEVPGNGGFLMTEPAENIDNFYLPEKEIVLFETVDDLAEKIRYFLANPKHRDEIATAGFVKTRDTHTYDLRFKMLLRESAGMKTTAPSAPPKTSCLTFNEAQKAHQANAFLTVVKQALLIPCNLIWGPTRGPRAARRILFELSWRLCGKKTYTASGWPGRLFYHES